MISAELLRLINGHLDALEDLSIAARLTKHRVVAALRLAQRQGQGFIDIDTLKPRSRSHGLYLLLSEMMRMRQRPRRSKHAQAWRLSSTAKPWRLGAPK
jgi:hypothetical protein